MLPRWAEPLWANTLRDNRGGGEEKRRRKAGGEGERKRRRKREEREKNRENETKRSKSGEPDNMPRLATKRGREKFERGRVGVKRGDCENHVRESRTFFTVVLEPNIHTFSVLSETLPDFLKSKLC